MRKLHRQWITCSSREFLIKLGFPFSLFNCCRPKEKPGHLWVWRLYICRERGSGLGLRTGPLHSKTILYLTRAKQILFQCIFGWIFPCLWPWCSWSYVFIEVLEDRVTVIEPHHLSFVDPEIPSEKILYNVTVPLLPGQGKWTCCCCINFHFPEHISSFPWSIILWRHLLIHLASFPSF